MPARKPTPERTSATRGCSASGASSDASTGSSSATRSTSRSRSSTSRFAIAAAQDQLAAVGPERLPDALPHQHPAYGHVPGGHALREDEHVRLDPEPLRSEHPARPAEARDDLVRDEQYVVLAAEPTRGFEKAGRGRDYAAGADHRLAEEGGDLVPAALEQVAERLRVVRRHPDRIGHQPPEALPVEVEPGDARPDSVETVVRPLAGHERLLLRTSERVPEASRELRSHVDRIAPARRQEDLRAGERRDRREPLAQLERRRRGVLLKGRVRLDPGHLLEDGLGDLAAPVADVAVPQARRGVEQPVAVRIPDERALAAHDHPLGVLDGGHVCLPVPEGSRRRRAHRLWDPAMPASAVSRPLSRWRACSRIRLRGMRQQRSPWTSSCIRHMLQETHATGPVRPASSWRTRSGSRMNGRAIEMKSASPRSRIPAIVSGRRMPPTSTIFASTWPRSRLANGRKYASGSSDRCRRWKSRSWSALRRLTAT